MVAKLSFLIVESECFLWKVDFHALLLTLLKRNLLKTLKLCIRCIIRTDLHINLNSFCTVIFSKIGNLRGYGDAILCEYFTVCLYSRKLILIIRKSITKRIHRILLHIAVGSSLHGIIGELRQFINTVIERKRKLSFRAHITKQNVRNRLATDSTRIPALNDCRNMLIGPVKGKRASGKHHKHDRLTAFIGHFQDFKL